MESITYDNVCIECKCICLLVQRTLKSRPREPPQDAADRSGVRYRTPKPRKAPRRALCTHRRHVPSDDASVHVPQGSARSRKFGGHMETPERSPLTSKRTVHRSCVQQTSVWRAERALQQPPVHETRGQQPKAVKSGPDCRQQHLSNADNEAGPKERPACIKHIIKASQGKQSQKKRTKAVVAANGKSPKVKVNTRVGGPIPFYSQMGTSGTSARLRARVPAAIPEQVPGLYR